MSLTPAPLSPRPGQPTVSTVVELNVGGQIFTTTLGTLRKIPGSKLTKMLSGSAPACTDGQGRFFIDRPSTYFSLILDYLRSGAVPTRHIPEVYQEARFYEIQPLVKLLEDTPQIFGEQVARKQFLLRVPGYHENLELLLRLARAEAVAVRQSSVLVCVVHTEQQAAWCAEPLCKLEAEKRPVVKFGPWKAGPAIKDLVDCLQLDIQAQGYQVQQAGYSLESAYRAKINDCFYIFTFTWW